MHACKLPEYFARFIRRWSQKPDKWEALLNEFLHAASEGEGNKYTLTTARNLCESYERGFEPEHLDYYGQLI